MKVLIGDNGARGHALAKKFSESPHVNQVICVNGNPGTHFTPKCRNMSAKNLDELIALAHEELPDIAVIGQEADLCAGAGDLWPKGCIFVGPSEDAARLEGDKAFADSLKQRLGIPTPGFAVCATIEAARRYLDSHDWSQPVVIKVAILALGKGVTIRATREEADADLVEIFVDKKFGETSVVFQDFVLGDEASVVALCMKRKSVVWPVARDHKPVDNGNSGKNTGGMGCVSPVSYMPDALVAQSMNTFIRPIVEHEELNFEGFLYSGQIVTPDGRILNLEYNVRPGDPETEVMIPRIKDDLAEVIMQGNDGNLPSSLSVSPQYCIGIVMAAGGYPDVYKKHNLIRGLDERGQYPRDPEVIVYHAGTVWEDGNFYTNGGRVLCIVATGDTLQEARTKAYAAVCNIWWEGVQFRTDIGWKAA